MPLWDLCCEFIYFHFSISTILAYSTAKIKKIDKMCVVNIVILTVNVFSEQETVEEMAPLIIFVVIIF